VTVVGPVVLVVGVVLGAVWWLRSGTDDSVPEPVSIEATGPSFATLDELVAASDVVVLGVVSDVDDGRSVTDPTDPTAGIRTQLAAVEVDDVLAGGHDGPLVVEQEAELLDGTPVRVNGVDPLRVGDRGYLFLIRGDSDEFPYTAFVNEQGWVPIVDDRVAPTDADDPVWSGYAAEEADAVVGAVRASAAAG
jgi:hypothetical protein